MTHTPAPLQAQSAPPTGEDLNWLTLAREDQRSTPTRLEETAKYLAAIISLSLTIFIDKRPATLQPWTQSVLAVASVLWILSALLSFFVLFPWRYHYTADSPSDIRRAYRKVISVKMTLLAVSVAFYLVALSIGVFAFQKGWDWNLASPMQIK